MDTLFTHIGIVGVGLIGGSLGQALSRVLPDARITGVGRDEARLKLAVRMGAIHDFSLDPPAAFPEFDLVIFATPVENIIGSLQKCACCFSPGTLVTDAGSTKRAICRAAWENFPPTVEFIGGHPIAGREVAGVENCLPDLFKNAPYVICPAPGGESQGLERLKVIVQRIGARPVLMPPEDHDRAIARVSHLPQLVSTALATLTRMEDLEISGSGLRDMLRLAGSGFDVWRGILDTNSDNIDSALDEMIRCLHQFRERLAAGGLAEEFDRAQECYSKVRGKR